MRASRAVRVDAHISVSPKQTNPISHQVSSLTHPPPPHPPNRYVVAFSMGPIDSPAAKLCIQVTDSPYVVVNLRLTTRMGGPALAKINAGATFIRCWHSVGSPVHDRNPGTAAHATARGPWPCDISRRKIVHFPESREVN